MNSSNSQTNQAMETYQQVKWTSSKEESKAELSQIQVTKWAQRTMIHPTNREHSGISMSNLQLKLIN